MGTKSILPPMKKHKFVENRPLDFIYDPTYTVADPQEYYKTVQQSMLQSSEYDVKPNYSAMFSDVTRYPRITLILKSANPIPNDVDPSFKGKMRAMECTPPPKVNVKGEDRIKFFRKPLQQQPPKRGYINKVQCQLYKPEFDEATSAISTPPIKKAFHKTEYISKYETTYETSCCQTDYRESETQTIPWAPPYVVTSAVTPEILTLTSLAWGQGLPAGVHEVEIIERARMKRAWEKLFLQLSNIDDDEKKYKYIEDIEKDEWCFREEEIQIIHSLRIELAEEHMKKKQKLQDEKYQDRMKHIMEIKDAEVKEKLAKSRLKRDRELRKLFILRRSMKLKKSGRGGALEELTDPTSQLHVPKLIYGDLSRNRHEDIQIDRDILTDYEALVFLENSRKPQKHPFDVSRLAKPKTYFEMCPKIMRWSEENMEKLQEDIKKIQLGGQHLHRTPNLIERLPPIKREPPVKTVPEPRIDDINLFRVTTFLQKVLRGRACQILMYEDREKFKYLIEELKSTHALEDIEKKKLTEMRYNSLKTRRTNLTRKRMEAKKKQLIALFSGEVASDLLVFLAEEQERLEDEQRIHAFAMLAERERWRREAAESGRRQRENQFRQQQDNAFKQVMKIRQETVDIYLEDVILNSMNKLAESKARKYIREVAKQVDLAAQEAHEREDIIEQEEIVLHLLHNFMVPEAHKEMVRRRLEARQRKFLEIANQTVYNTLLTSEPASTLEEPDFEVKESIFISKNIEAKKEEEKEKPTSKAKSSLMMTECIEKTASEEALFEQVQNEEQKSWYEDRIRFIRVKGPLKQLADGSIEFTKDLLEEATEQAMERQEIIDFAQSIIENIVKGLTKKKEPKDKKRKSKNTPNFQKK